MADEEQKRAWEHGLPECLQRDLDAFKEGRAAGSSLLDCLWGELYGEVSMRDLEDDATFVGHSRRMWRIGVVCRL